MVSVIIPTYNRANTIKAAVYSVLHQTYTDLELIVVDDGSQDDTEQILAPINDKRLKYVKQSNSGACSARNHGIELSHGDYIAFHDSDDIWHPNKLEKQISVIQKTGADLVFCKYNCYKKGKEKIKEPDSYQEGFLNPVENVFGIGTQTLLGRKELFQTIKFDLEMPRFQEFEMLLRMVDRYKIYCMDEALVDYRREGESISSNPVKLYEACKLILLKHPQFIERYPKMANIMSKRLLKEVVLLKDEQQDYAEKMLKIAHICNQSFLISIYIRFRKIQFAFRKGKLK